jgi:hypothetical protein
MEVAEAAVAEGSEREPSRLNAFTRWVVTRLDDEAVSRAADTDAGGRRASAG